MSAINNITIVGRLVKDPIVRELSDKAHKVTLFSVAVAKPNKADKNNAIFIDCKAWDNSGDFVGKYFKKGDKIAVQGELDTSTYTDPEGTVHRRCEVVVTHASFMSGKYNAAATDAAEEVAEPLYTEEEEQDLPF